MVRRIHRVKSILNRPPCEGNHITSTARVFFISCDFDLGSSICPIFFPSVCLKGFLHADGNDCHLTHNPEEPQHKNNQLSQSEPGGNSVVPSSNNELETEKSKNVQDENKCSENDPLEGTEKDGGDEGKKFKEAKGSRAFKFALVEFIKELLKPSWKDGQISKDAYKTMVKKVVDKVTSTMQGANIPQTRED